MLKFIHAADLHIDSPLRGLELYDGAPAERIRDATRRALENLVELAIRERVAFVLIAGDLYDGDWQDYNTGLYLGRQMSRLREAKIPVFLIAGNHDAQSKMTRKLRLPENVRMLSTDSPDSHRLDDLGIAIHGQGFPTQAVNDDLSQNYPTATRGLYNIGLLHTCVSGADGHARYAPCTIAGLNSKGYDYWALGHVHTRQILSEAPFIGFPGNTQGRHARETGPKGCYLVTLGDNLATHVEFRRLDVVRWERCEFSATEAENEEDVADLVGVRLAQILAREDPDHLLAVRVEIAGPTCAHERLLSAPERSAAAIQTRANDLGADRLWIEQIKIRTSPLRTRTVQSDGPFEELFAVIAELREDSSKLLSAAKPLLEIRQRLPIEWNDQPDAPRLDDPEWLRSVLDAAEALLHARLQS